MRINRRLREQFSDWTDEHKRVLCGEPDHHRVFDPERPRRGVPVRPRPDYTERPDVDAMRREAWAELGVELIADWIEQHPGTRPAFWWRYERGVEPPANERDELARIGALTGQEVTRA